MAKAAAMKVHYDEAKLQLLADKQPSCEFVTPEQLGELTAFMCSPGTVLVMYRDDVCVNCHV